MSGVEVYLIDQRTEMCGATEEDYGLYGCTLLVPGSADWF